MKYNNFIKDRDDALQKMFFNNQVKITEISSKYFEIIIGVVSSNFTSPDLGTYTRRQINEIKYKINYFFDEMCSKIAYENYYFSFLVVNLVNASETEALSRIKNKKDSVAKKIFPKKSYEEYYSSTIISTSKTRNAFITSIERSHLLDESVIDAKKRLQSLIPPFEKINRPLKKVKESSYFYKSSGQSISQDTIDDETWENILYSYKNEYIPEYRAVDKKGKHIKATDGRYAWEVEKESTENFLNEVKRGTVEASKESGIDDLLWNAVIDHKTRHSHSMFDGLTSSEIKKNLKTIWRDDERFNQDRDDFGNGECVAPNGFNCRCRSVPYVKDIDEVKNEFPSFEEWLNED